MGFSEFSSRSKRTLHTVLYVCTLQWPHVPLSPLTALDICRPCTLASPPHRHRRRVSGTPSTAQRATMTDRSTIAQPVYDGRAALSALPMRLIDSLLNTEDSVLDTTQDELSQLENDIQCAMQRRRSQNGDLSPVGGPVDPLFPSDLVEEWARRYSRATFIAWAIEHAQIDSTKFDTTEAQGLPEGGTTLLSPEAKSVTAYLTPLQAYTV